MIGTVAAINRKRALLAIRCADGRYTLTTFPDGWHPSVGEAVEGELMHLGQHKFAVGEERIRLDVQSFNCSAVFARERLLD